MTAAELYRIRIALVQAFLIKHDYDGILLGRVDNYAMVTGGKRNYINTYGDMGANSFFVNRDGVGYFVGNSIEAQRQQVEELAELGCDRLEYLWFEGSPAAAVSEKFSGQLVSDDGTLGKNVNGDLAVLRSLLTSEEMEKYRRLGALAASAMESTLHSIEAGMTETDIAARLIYEGQQRWCHVPVALVAADERIAQFRHPLPTIAPLTEGHLKERVVREYVMLVGCFMREGLVVSMTRFAQVGTLPEGIEDAYLRIAAVDAEMQEATQPGQNLGEVFAACQAAYARMGFPVNEWHNHHQGGATGYAGRTSKGTPGSRFPVLDTEYKVRVNELLGTSVEFGAAFAWNPSAVGVKSEDTFILDAAGNQEIVSKTASLPTLDLSGVLGHQTQVCKSGIYKR